MCHVFALALVFALNSGTTAYAWGPESLVKSLPEELAGQTISLNAQYLLFMPEVERPTKMPLLIYLHGAGGAGEDVRRLRGQAGVLWRGIETFGKGPCMVVAPGCLLKSVTGDRGTWEPADLDILLSQLLKTLPVDVQRVYLTGNSMGGYGTWAWAAHSPEHFAAVAPVSGGLGPEGPKDITGDIESWAARLARVPVYAFAGANDRVVPADRSERMIDAIQKCGGQKAMLKIYPDEGHAVGRLVYAGETFYEWLFSSRRK